MGAHNIDGVYFGKTAEEAQKKAWEHDERYYGHQEGYSGAFNAKAKGVVKAIDESDLKNRDRRTVMNEILHDHESPLAKRYEEIQSRSGPTGAISLKGTQEAKRYRERKGLKGKHGTVWLLFGFART